VEQSEDRHRAGAEAGAGNGGNAPRAGGTGDVDVEALADRVYRLMLAEARLDRARGAPPARQRG
jgi:hypothetical protein